MIPKKSFNSKSSKASTSGGCDKRPKPQVKQSNSQRIKSETPRPHCGIQWNDVKTGFRHLKIKRWNSIGSWVPHCHLYTYKKKIMNHFTEYHSTNLLI